MGRCPAGAREAAATGLSGLRHRPAALGAAPERPDELVVSPVGCADVSVVAGGLQARRHPACLRTQTSSCLREQTFTRGNGICVSKATATLLTFICE